ncbi:hypothetical protein DFP74_4878 [Nocardiopsis sp. Huas11]|uniref:class I SAM-dependent methyltransferase n=1 Tax=Nocardiopsis sp. Huas11 TaxID=2183912 RepID=UPI000EADE0FC|nr:class I SAM-dependent methyltransferase [Nocardiopsis sp. Huas11]RKS09149.1 hypothetical protein DFP74_4878 [Nocardiopsis sp. Huas11]
MSSHHDDYAHSAEFIDVMIAGWWEAFGGHVAEAVASMKGAEGPVIDVGAGGGAGTRVLLDTLPEAEVIAVEPAPGLRAVLLSRAADPVWSGGRVTVDGEDLLSARLPERFGGLLAMNVLGHFTPLQRARIWEMLAQRLAPGSVALVNLLPPQEPTTVERTMMSEFTVGRRDYRGWSAAEPTGPESVRWSMTYEVYEGGERVRSTDVDYDWWVLTGEGLRAEAARHGLDAAPTGPDEAGLYLLRHGAGARA